jgi:hypothetical protein
LSPWVFEARDKLVKELRKQLMLREPVKPGSVHSSQFGPGVPKHVGG